MDFAVKRFNGARGLGIDIDAAKIEQAQSNGYDAILYDIRNIPDEKLFRFTIMSHFLEHVPSHVDTKDFIRKACRISNEFVYIQQPFFDADPYLFERGLKLFWSDWKGHPNRMTSLELWIILRDLMAEGLEFTYSLHAYKDVLNSDDTCVHPVSSDIEQHAYDPLIHPAKPSIEFDNNVFYELVCLITFAGTDHSDILNKMRYNKTIFTGSNSANKD